MAATGAAPGNSAVRRGQALSLEEGFGKRAPKRCGSKEGGRDAVPGAGRRKADVPPPCAPRQTAAVTASEVKRIRTRL